jgi:hypothetical protein
VLGLGDEMKRQIPKTHQALEWVGKGLTAAQAARKMEISESSVYAALKRSGLLSNMWSQNKELR